MMQIGVDRIGTQRPRASASPSKVPSDVCPYDGARGEFRQMTLVCPKCQAILGGC